MTGRCLTGAVIAFCYRPSVIRGVPLFPGHDHGSAS